MFHAHQKTKLFCGFILTVVFALWLFWDSLSSIGIEWYLKKEIQRRLGSEFQAEQIIWGDQTILFVHPKLVSADASPTTTHRFHDQQIAVTYRYSLLQRRIFLDIRFDSPSFAFGSETENIINAIVNDKAKRHRYFHLDWHLVIPRGTLEQKNATPIAFSLDMTNEKSLQGNFFIEFDSLSSSNQTFEGRFISQSPHQYHIDCNFQQTPLPKIAHQLQFFENPLKHLHITSGQVDGKATFMIHKKSPLVFDGELTFSNIQANYLPLELNVYLSKANLKSTEDSSKRTSITIDNFHLKAIPWHLSVNLPRLQGDLAAYLNTENILSSLDGPLTISKANLSFSLPNKQAHTFQEIHGTLNFNQGLLEKSIFNLQFAERNSQFTLQSNLNQGLFNLSFQGSLIQLAPFFSQDVGDCIRSQFNLATLLVDTSIQTSSQKTTFDSSIHLLDHTEKDKHTLNLGFALEKNHSSPSKNSSRFLLKDGWFKGKHFPLELLVEPFILSNVRLCGEIDVEGTFDKDKMTTRYQTQNITLEYENLYLETLPNSAKIGAIGQHTFHFRQNHDSGNIQVKRGYLNSLGENVALDHLTFDFNYDRKAKTLLIEKLKGTVSLGSQEDGTGYTLIGNYIHLNNLLKRQAKFDLSLFNERQEIVKLIGYTRPSPSGNKHEELLSVFLDKDRSHINQMPFIRSELAFNDLLQIDHCHLEFNLDLQKFASRLQELSSTKFWHEIGLTNHQWASLQNSQGTLHVDLNYHQSKGLLLFGAKGSNLTFYSHPIKKVILNGKKQGHLWSVEQLQIDDYSVAADFIKENQKWAFNFLGFRWKNSLLAGLKGDYFADQETFNGTINLLEVDLHALKEIPSLSAFINQYDLQGTLKGTGILEIARSEGSWKANTYLKSSIQNPQFLNILFENVHHASIQFTLGEKLLIKQMILPFKATHQQAVAAHEHAGFISIEKGEFDLTQNALTFDAIQFDIPSARLSEMSMVMQRYFPSALDVSILDAIKNSTLGKPLQGRISLNLNPKDHGFRLELAQGKYTWLNGEHEISHFALEKNSKQIQAVLKYRLDNQPFWILLNAEGPQFTQGQIFLSDELAAINGPPTSSQALTIDWTNTPPHGFAILKALGTFGGLHVDLVKHPQKVVSEQSIPLIGKVMLNIGKERYLLPGKLKQLLSDWKIDQTYAFTGQWEFNKQNRSRLGNFSFQGGLSGQNIIFKGYELEFMQADAFYTHDTVRIHNLLIQDPAGFLQIDQLLGTYQQDHSWHIALGNCEVTNWQPSLLRSIDQTPLLNDSHLHIPQLRISQVQGVLEKPSSFTGAGEMSFDNRSKRVSHHPLIVIPTEIINRIGLDLSILSPVSGNILFNIQDGKFIVTKLKDVYSEGKISKFNLASGSAPSYMDFEGHLHLKIRMKHYNILFKLAELFTFTVTGSLQKPIYSISKQPKKRLFS